MALKKAQALTAHVKSFYNKFEKHLADKAFENNNISTDKMDEDQVANYDLAWVAAELFAIEEMIAYPEKARRLQRVRGAQQHQVLEREAQLVARAARRLEL